MNTRNFVFSTIAAGVAAFAVIRYSRQLKLIYNDESDQVVIDRKRWLSCCDDTFIESLVVSINGEVYKGFDYAEDEKPFTNAIFVDVPELEAGDLIEVKMKTRCSKRMNKWGKLEII